MTLNYLPTFILVSCSSIETLKSISMFHCSGVEVPNRVREFGEKNSEDEHILVSHLGLLQEDRSNIHRHSYERHDT